MPEQVATRSYGQRGISEALREFIAEFPFERGPIFDFVAAVAAETAPGAAVLDLGAGNAPYRELFAHTRYSTSDWARSPHAGAAQADIVSPADDLPVGDGTFELVLCTQVLEHVPEPHAVLRECFRVLSSGGRLTMTVPLLWELHELPHDYYRYTAAGVQHQLEVAGFEAVDVAPRGDGFSALAQLMSNLAWSMGDQADGLSEARAQAHTMLLSLAGEIAGLAPLDVRKIMPLGYCASARKP